MLRFAGDPQYTLEKADCNACSLVTKSKQKQMTKYAEGWNQLMVGGWKKKITMINEGSLLAYFYW